jgi:signal transduction histidine kinase
MNRKDFLKRLGLLSTAAVATPVLLTETLQSQSATTKPVESVERARFGADGSFMMKDLDGNITYHVTHDGRVLVGKK